MESGRLRSRLAIQGNTPGLPSPVGQPKPDWATVATVWAEILTTGGDQSPNADQTKALTTTKITIRQSPAFTVEPGKNRIVYKGRIYNIVSVTAVDNLNVFYEIQAKQVYGDKGQA